MVTRNAQPSTGLLLLASILAIIPIGFGINAVLNPESALSFFELEYPILPAQQQLVDALLVIYGARDVFMGIATFIGMFYGGRKGLGATTLAVASMAFVDGAVCKWMVGHGEMNHWGYAPMLAALGAYLLSVK